MSAVEKFQDLIAEQAPKLASVPRSCRQLDPAISGAAFGTHDIGSSHGRRVASSSRQFYGQEKQPFPKSKATTRAPGAGQNRPFGKSKPAAEKHNAALAEYDRQAALV